MPPPHPPPASSSSLNVCEQSQEEGKSIDHFDNPAANLIIGIPPGRLILFIH